MPPGLPPPLLELPPPGPFVHPINHHVTLPALQLLWQNLALNQSLRQLSCDKGHVFHTHCLLAWMQTSQACPKCGAEPVKPSVFAPGGVNAGHMVRSPNRLATAREAGAPPSPQSKIQSLRPQALPGSKPSPFVANVTPRSPQTRRTPCVNNNLTPRSPGRYEAAQNSSDTRARELPPCWTATVGQPRSARPDEGKATRSDPAFHQNTCASLEYPGIGACPRPTESQGIERLIIYENKIQNIKVDRGWSEQNPNVTKPAHQPQHKGLTMSSKEEPTDLHSSIQHLLVTESR